MPGEVREVFFGGFADFAGDVDRGAADRVFAFFGRPFRQRGPVAGEDRGAFGELDVGGEFLACPQPGEGEVGVPFDAVLGVGNLDLAFDFAEGDRCDRYLDRHDPAGAGAGVLGVPRRADLEGSRRRHLLGVAVGGFEFLAADPRPRRFVQLRVHRFEVLPLPGLGEALGGFGLRRARGTGGEADHESDQSDEGQRQGAGEETAAALRLGGD